MDGDFESGGQRDDREDRPRGVSKARLADLDLDTTIAIYYKARKHDANTILIPSFPKAAATLFCSKIFKKVKNDEQNDLKVEYYTVIGGDRTAYISIFNWIKDCVDQQAIIKFPDIPEPEDSPYKSTLDIIIAGNILDIPAGSLSFFLEKRLNFIARKHLMPFSQVEEFYTDGSEPNKAGLKKIACASIFNAWWDCRLDQSIDPKAMEELSDMRDKHPDLDQDLHDAVEEKRNAIEKSRLEKKLKREAAQQSTGADNSFGGGGGGWSQSAEGVSVGTSDWNTGTTDTPAGWESVATPATTDWDKENVAGVNLFDHGKLENEAYIDVNKHETAAAFGGDWADEVNESQASSVYTGGAVSAW